MYPARLPEHSSEGVFQPAIRETVYLPNLWAAITRRRRWIVLSPIAVIIAAAVFTSFQHSRYESTTTILIKSSSTPPSPLAEVAQFAGLGGNSSVRTEVEILQSRQVAQAVVDSLGLQLQLVQPQVTRATIFSSIAVAPSATASQVVLQYAGSGAYQVDAQMAGTASGVPSRIEIGQPFRFGGLEATLSPELLGDPPDRIRFVVNPRRAAIESVLDNLEVTPLDGNEVIAINFESTDASLAAAVPNSIARSYVVFKAQTNASETLNTITFLQSQVDSYGKQLTAAENQLQRFREQQQVVSIPEDATEHVKRLAELNAERADLATQRDVLARLLQEVREAGPGVPQTEQYRRLASFPEFFRNPGVQDILRSLIDLENRRADLLVRRTMTNADVQGITERIKELDGQLYRTANDYLKNLDAQIASLDAGLGRFDNEIEAIPERETEFARLTRQTKLLQDLYLLLQHRLKETEIQNAADQSPVQVLDPALVPDRPVSPRPLLNLTLAAALGLMLGVGIAFAGAVMDPTIRSEELAIAAADGLPALAMIPVMRPPLELGSGQPRRRRPFMMAVRDAGSERALVTNLEPQGMSAEAYRRLRANLAAAASDRPQIVLVTSPLSGDGKSTVAANLAVVYAQQGLRTLVIDADLRKGNLHKLFGVPQQPGLSQVLNGQVALEDAIQEFGPVAGGAQLQVLTAGPYPAHPAEALGSSRMHDLLQGLRAMFAVIIIDTPPLNFVTDGAVLGGLADATLLITRIGMTDKGALEAAADQLRRLNVDVNGIVINGAPLREGAWDRYMRS